MHGLLAGNTANDVFFFQAEDGIRDRSPSRGLGDVYKRQQPKQFNHKIKKKPAFAVFPAS